MLTSPNSYDVVPYYTKPRRSTHPATAATVARLNGLKTPPVDQCRVLEIGCGTGGNLIPLADLLPRSYFLGIDPSAVQIQMARDSAERLQIDNIRFEAIGVEELPESAGPFDYVICHGVFSWVPPRVQHALLDVVARRMSPTGVAMISFNVLPGWHYRAVARDAIRFVAGRGGNAEEQIRRGRGYLRFLSQSVIDPESSHARNLKKEDEILSESHDFYIFHEHLEAMNQPMYFRDFVQLAESHGLQYLGEAGFHPLLAGLKDEVVQFLSQPGLSLIDLEQHVDFIRCRSFRHTLLVHAAVPLCREQKHEAVRELLIQAAAVADPATAESGLAVQHHYRSMDGVEMSTASPLMNAILGILIPAFPQGFRFDELHAGVLQAFEREQPEHAAEADEKLLPALLSLLEAGFLRLHAWLPRLITQVTTRPIVWRIAAHAAKTDKMVPCLLHSLVTLDALDAVLVQLCDGSRTVDDLAKKMQAVELEKTKNLGPDALRTLVFERIQGYARSGLLVG